MKHGRNRNDLTTKQVHRNFNKTDRWNMFNQKNMNLKFIPIILKITSSYYHHLIFLEAILEITQTL